MDATEEKNGKKTLIAYRETSMELDDLYSYFPKSCGLSDPEYWSLLLIYKGVVTQSRISGILYVSRQTINSAFKQLVKKELITLEPYEDNQRSKKASLTSEGRRIVEEQVAYMHQKEEQAWGKLSEEEREQLARLTRKFTDALRETIGDLKK